MEQEAQQQVPVAKYNPNPASGGSSGSRLQPSCTIARLHRQVMGQTGNRVDLLQKRRTIASNL